MSWPINRLRATLAEAISAFVAVAAAVAKSDKLDGIKHIGLGAAGTASCLVASV